jgi:hypothetical protein
MVVIVSARARTEIELWATQLRELPVMPLTPHRRTPDFRLDADASATAAAALFYDLRAGGEPVRIHRELSERERTQSSTLRELLGYAHAVGVLAREHGEGLRGHLVEIVGDSQAAGAIFRRGGSQRVDDESGELELYEAFLDVLEAAAGGGFSVVFRWVPREQLVDADALSKFADRFDFSLTSAAAERVTVWLRQELPALFRVGAAGALWDCDRFADGHNATVARFNSQFSTVGSDAVDGFAHQIGDHSALVLPLEGGVEGVSGARRVDDLHGARRHAPALRRARAAGDPAARRSAGRGRGRAGRAAAGARPPPPLG